MQRSLVFVKKKRETRKKERTAKNKTILEDELKKMQEKKSTTRTKKKTEIDGFESRIALWNECNKSKPGTKEETEEGSTYDTYPSTSVATGIK